MAMVSQRKILGSLNKRFCFLIPYHGHASLNAKNATLNKRHVPDFPGHKLRQNISTYIYKNQKIIVNVIILEI